MTDSGIQFFHLAAYVFASLVNAGLLSAIAILLVKTGERFIPHVHRSHDFEPLVLGITSVISVTLIGVHVFYLFMFGVPGNLKGNINLQEISFTRAFAIVLVCSFAHLILVKYRKQKLLHYSFALFIAFISLTEIFLTGGIRLWIEGIQDPYNVTPIWRSSVFIIFEFLAFAIVSTFLASIFWFITIRKNPRYVTSKTGLI